MGEPLGMDVAGSLFTSMYRNVKIKGQEPATQNLDGTGSVRDVRNLLLDRMLVERTARSSLECAAITA